MEEKSTCLLKRFSPAILWILIGMFASCSEDAVPPVMYTVDELAVQGLLVSPDADEFDVLCELGVPSSREIHALVPIHALDPDYSDNLIIYRYPGIEIIFYQINGGSHITILLASVNVSSASILEEYGYSGDTGPQELMELNSVNEFSEHRENDRLYLRFYSSGSPTGFPSILFCFENDCLTEVTLESYLD